MTDPEIWAKVEQFRAQHAPHLNAEMIPLDLVTFADLELKLDLIPYDGLRGAFDADAAVLGDFSGFYIDGSVYDRLETLGRSEQNRLRFSLAHELGHWVLHREIFHSAGISSSEALREWLNDHGGDRYRIEREANEFAGRLLVPISVLAPVFEKFAGSYDANFGAHGWQSRPDLRSQVCELLSQKFGLHPDGISVRLDREHLWPSIF